MLLKMRPHHSVCLQFFVSKGYSCGFVENMERIKHELENRRGTEIVFVAENDAICASCPKNVKLSARPTEKLQGTTENALKPWGSPLGTG